MLTKITKKQKAALVAHRQRYFDLATSTDPADRPKAEATIRELAARWSVSPTTIRRLVWRREIQAERVGGQVRIRESVAEAYLVAHMEPALPPIAAGGRAS